MKEKNSEIPRIKGSYFSLKLQNLAITAVSDLISTI